MAETLNYLGLWLNQYMMEMKVFLALERKYGICQQVILKKSISEKLSKKQL